MKEKLDTSLTYIPTQNSYTIVLGTFPQEFVCKSTLGFGTVMLYCVYRVELHLSGIKKLISQSSAIKLKFHRISGSFSYHFTLKDIANGLAISHR